jgi:hypothetical protein
VTYFAAFAGGLAGSLHCIGMCGGFPVLLAQQRPDGGLRRIALYNAARVNTLGAIGALAGGLGGGLAAWAPAAYAERLLAVGAGLVMVAVGLELLGLVAARGARVAARLQETLRPLLGAGVRSNATLGPLALGVFNAFLPCHLIYGFAALAATTGSMVGGLCTMLAFGAGTLPAMMSIGTVGMAVPLRLRPGLSRAGGLLVLALGTVTAMRGLAACATGGHVH